MYQGGRLISQDGGWIDFPSGDEIIMRLNIEAPRLEMRLSSQADSLFTIDLPRTTGPWYVYANLYHADTVLELRAATEEKVTRAGFA